MNYKDGKTQIIEGFNSIEEFTLEVKKLNREIDNHMKQLEKNKDYER